MDTPSANIPLIASQHSDTIAAANSQTEVVKQLYDALTTQNEDMTGLSPSDQMLKHEQRHRFEQWKLTPDGQQYYQWEQVAHNQIAQIINNTSLVDKARDKDIINAVTALGQQDQKIREIADPEKTKPFIMSLNPTVDMVLMLLEFVGPILMVIDFLLRILDFYIPVVSDVIAFLWPVMIVIAIVSHFLIKHRDLKRVSEEENWNTTHYTVEERDRRILQRLTELAHDVDGMLPDSFSWAAFNAKGYAYMLLKAMKNVETTQDLSQLPQLRELVKTDTSQYDKLAPNMRDAINQLN